MLLVGALSTFAITGVWFALELGWSGVAALGGIIGVGGLAAWGLSRARRVQHAREVRQWAAEDAKLVRDEKVEELGHTLGGLSTADLDQDGQLSETSGLERARERTRAARHQTGDVTSESER